MQWQWLSSGLLTIQVLSSLSIIVLVLLQQGKGAGMGAAFGSGSAGSVFGSSGAANFLSRTTKWAAIVFFVSTGGLAWVAHNPAGAPAPTGIMQGYTDPSVPSAPGGAVPAAVPSVPSTSSVPSAPSADPAVPAAPASSN